MKTKGLKIHYGSRSRLMSVTKATVHPLVLLFAVDHYNREAKGSRTKRACGILMGTVHGGVADIANCFAVPFEENLSSGTWFMDSQFIVTMRDMQKKVTAKEVVIGWYSAFPDAKIRPCDLAIQRMVKKYCKDPVFLVVDVEPKNEFPTTAYISAVEETSDGAEQTLSFRHIPSEYGAQEAEEIGVEHLLRDMLDANLTSLAFTAFVRHLESIQLYLNEVLEHKLPLNQQIMRILQEIFNLIPNINLPELSKGLIGQANNTSLVLFASHLVRVVLSLHSLVVNKMELQHKAEQEAREEEEKKMKEKEEKEKEAQEKESKEKKKRDDAIKELEEQKKLKEAFHKFILS